MEIYFQTVQVRSLITILLFVSVASAGLASDQKSKEYIQVQEAIENVMSERHPVDNEKFWIDLGPLAVDVILDILPTMTSHVKRDRLTLALGFYGDDSRAVSYLKKSIQTEENLVQKKYLYTNYARALSRLSSTQVGPELKDCFMDKNPDLRLGCALAVRQFAPKDSVELSEWIANEKVDWVKQKYLNKLPLIEGPIGPSSSSEVRFWARNLGSKKFKVFTWDPGSRSVKLKAGLVKISLNQKDQNQIKIQGSDPDLGWDVNDQVLKYKNVLLHYQENFGKIELRVNSIDTGHSAKNSAVGTNAPRFSSQALSQGTLWGYIF